MLLSCSKGDTNINLASLILVFGFFFETAIPEDLRSLITTRGNIVSVLLKAILILVDSWPFVFVLVSHRFHCFKFTVFYPNIINYD